MEKKKKRNCQMVFQNGCIVFHPRQHHVNVPLTPYPVSAGESQWHAAGSCRDTWVTTAASCSRTDGKQDLLGPTQPGPPGKTDLSGSEEAELRRLE